MVERAAEHEFLGRAAEEGQVEDLAGPLLPEHPAELLLQLAGRGHEARHPDGDDGQESAQADADREIARPVRRGPQRDGIDAGPDDEPDPGGKGRESVEEGGEEGGDAALKADGRLDRGWAPFLRGFAHLRRPIFSYTSTMRWTRGWRTMSARERLLNEMPGIPLRISRTS